MKQLMLIFFLFSSFNCFYTPTGPAHTELGKEFDLQYGKKAVIGNENLYITFKDVLNDSRCPIGFACLWAGNAEVLLKVQQSNSDILIDTLNTASESPNLIYHNYNIMMKSLKPYPVADSVIKKKDYVVTLLVEKMIR
ncbi:MAG: hypothetical protein WCE54_22390 [Ignavibacteriaceae bacterium]